MALRTPAASCMLTAADGGHYTIVVSGVSYSCSTSLRFSYSRIACAVILQTPRNDHNLMGTCVSPPFCFSWFDRADIGGGFGSTHNFTWTITAPKPCCYPRQTCKPPARKRPLAALTHLRMVAQRARVCNRDGPNLTFRGVSLRPGSRASASGARRRQQRACRRMLKGFDGSFCTFSQRNSRSQTNALGAAGESGIRLSSLCPPAILQVLECLSGYPVHRRNAVKKWRAHTGVKKSLRQHARSRVRP